MSGHNLCYGRFYKIVCHLLRQLAHAERNSVVKAYNHAQHLSKRREMMQWWADYLDEIESKALEVD